MMKAYTLILIIQTATDYTYCCLYFLLLQQDNKETKTFRFAKTFIRYNTLYVIIVIYTYAL
jgi:hypothetical protein